MTRVQRLWAIIILAILALSAATLFWGIDATTTVGYPIVGAYLLLDSAATLRKRCRFNDLAGSVELTLRWPRLAFWDVTTVALLVAPALWGTSRPSIPLLSTGAYALGAIAVSIVQILCRPQIRANGLVEGVRFVPWGRIVFYTATEIRNELAVITAVDITVRYRLDAPPYTEQTMTIRTGARKREITERLLTRHGIWAEALDASVPAHSGSIDSTFSNRQM